MKTFLKNLSTKLTSEPGEFGTAQILNLFEDARQSGTDAALASYHHFDTGVAAENLDALIELESLAA